jgi:hypothetical protein
MKIADLPVGTLFDANSAHRQQALVPVFSCFPVYRNISENETAESCKEFVRNDSTKRYHPHADLVCVPELFVYMYIYILYVIIENIKQ